MKKRIRASILAAFMCLTLLTTPAFAYDISMTQETLTIENGVFTNESARPIQDAIDQYFELRESGTHSMSSSLISQELISDTDDRIAAMHQYYRDLGLYVIGYNNSAEVLSAEPIQGTRNMAVTVYEWTWLFHSDKINPDSNSVWKLGFSTTHNMVLSPCADGKFLIISDSYDENDVTGYTSRDYVSLPLSGPFLSELALSTPPTAELMANNSYMPNLSACVNYADTHYNAQKSSIYGYAPQNDCCNFVSQCLHAGGFSIDGSSSNTLGDTSKWWHSKRGNLSQSSYSWRLVEYFCAYWGSKYEIVRINSDCSNVFPGNPIFASDKSHIAICVGYNGGRPVYDAHTNDRYRTYVSSADFQYTILLNCTGNHNKVYESNATRHRAYCSTCTKELLSWSSHHFKQSGVYYICTLCGYKTTNPASTSSIARPQAVLADAYRRIV